MRPTFLNRLVTAAIQALPSLLLLAAGALRKQARNNLARIERLQQATIWLDRTTVEVETLVARLDAVSVSAARRPKTLVRSIPVYWSK